MKLEYILDTHIHNHSVESAFLREAREPRGKPHRHKENT